jgi:hypothetical protein
MNISETTDNNATTQLASDIADCPVPFRLEELHSRHDGEAAQVRDNRRHQRPKAPPLQALTDATGKAPL